MWQPIETAPKDRPIVVWHDHDSDPYHDGERLTIYGAHAEGLGVKVDAGPYVAEWGGAWQDSADDGGGSIPDWWFEYGSEFEAPLAPTRWKDVDLSEPKP